MKIQQNLSRWIIIGLAGMCSTSWAATVVKRELQGNTEKIIMEGQQVRIETQNSNYYTLMYLAQSKTYMIEVKEKRIIEMDIVGKPPKLPPNRHPMPKPPWGDSVNAELVEKGNGPNIAGYPTKRYQIKALGKACSDNYFSKEVASHIDAFLEASDKMINSRKIKGMFVHPCQQAYDDLKAKMRKQGVSMKLVLKGGKKGDMVMYEITDIQTNVKVSAALFKLPMGYKTISEQKMIEERQVKMKAFMEQKAKQGGAGSQFPPGGWR